MKNEVKIGETEIVVKIGDLTEEEADALVNAANNELWMGGGVAGALRRKGGKVVEEEAVSQGPISIGEAVATSAGSLRAKYVIHGAVMGMDFKTDANKIRRATLNTLKRAEELKLKTVAFPAFGTGVGRFPAEEAAKAMFEGVKEHLRSIKSTLGTISFVLFNDETYEAFRKIANEVLG